VETRPQDFDMVNNIVVFDGDVTRQQLEKIKMKMYNNYVLLPQKDSSPEKTFCDYIENLDGVHEFFSETHSESLNFSKMYFREEYEKILNSNSKERDAYKDWFCKHRDGFDAVKLYDYWKEDNELQYRAFVTEFIDCYNIVAKRNHLPILEVTNQV
jgi:hypothetical protein